MPGVQNFTLKAESRLETFEFIAVEPRNVRTERLEVRLSLELHAADCCLQIDEVHFVAEFGQIRIQHRFRLAEPAPGVDGHSILTQRTQMVRLRSIEQSDRATLTG